MDAHALLKLYLSEKLKSGEVKGDDVDALKKNFGLSEIVSNRGFMRALTSLQHSDKTIVILRPIKDYDEGGTQPSRRYLVKLI